MQVPAPRPDPAVPDRAAGDVLLTLRPCPECQRSLEFLEGLPGLHGHCPCGGVFVAPECFPVVFRGPREPPTPDQLQALKRERTQRYRAQPVRYRRCPICHELMQRRNFCDVSGLVVDVCFQDGTFFPPDTYPQALEFVERGGLHLMHRHRRVQAPATAAAGFGEMIHTRAGAADFVLWPWRLLTLPWRLMRTLAERLFGPR